MLTSIRKSDNTKVLGFQIDKNPTEEYYCEYCNEIVIHHKSNSQIKIGHFKHKYAHCPNSNRESREHIETKASILCHFQKLYPHMKIELEKWICNNSMRPDVYIETSKGTRIAIEIQASQLTVDQVLKRTQRYAKENIYVLWILIWNKSKIQYSPFFENKCHLNHCNQRECDHSIKLTEMELLFHWMYMKHLIYWDLEKDSSEGFYVIKFDNFISEGTEFYDSSGEHQMFDGRVAKNKKLIVDATLGKQFNSFLPKRLSPFKIPRKNYELPFRLIMLPNI